MKDQNQINWFSVLRLTKVYFLDTLINQSIDYILFFVNKNCIIKKLPPLVVFAIKCPLVKGSILKLSSDFLWNPFITGGIDNVYLLYTSSITYKHHNTIPPNGWITFLLSIKIKTLYQQQYISYYYYIFIPSINTINAVINQTLTRH